MEKKLNHTGRPQTYKEITMKVKAKAPYFMSVTRNNT